MLLYIFCGIVGMFANGAPPSQKLAHSINGDFQDKDKAKSVLWLMMISKHFPFEDWKTSCILKQMK